MAKIGKAAASVYVALLVSFASARADEKALLSGAQKESKAVYYFAMEMPLGQSLAKAFEQRYPGVKVEIYRATSERLLTKILTETRSGRHAFDVVSINVEMFGVLQRNKLIGPHRSASFDAYPKGFVDPQGYWTSIYYNPYTVAHNTRMVKPSEAPQRWEDLLDPKWKGKLGMDNTKYAWSNALIEIMGQEKAVKFFRALAEQNIDYRGSYTLLAQLMAAGEIPVCAYNSVSSIERLKGNGAPIDWVRMKSPIPASVVVAGVASNAARPNAGKLLYEFLVSKEGQEIYAAHDKIVARKDIRGGLMAEMKNLDIRPNGPSTEEEFNKGVALFQSIFGKPKS
ncbi:MAG TPA: extracellular solute-binding protein [Candidatus Acidoferrales bacterium]|nr:extracellular solute-binding protein [Candidatus Acidoferrales bacterium]